VAQARNAGCRAACCNARDEQLGALAVVLQQVKRHARGGLDADAGQAAQRIDQCVERSLASAINRSERQLHAGRAGPACRR
jgi:hypothetical protein